MIPKAYVVIPNYAIPRITPRKHFPLLDRGDIYKYINPPTSLQLANGIFHIPHLDKWYNSNQDASDFLVNCLPCLIAVGSMVC